MRWVFFLGLISTLSACITSRDQDEFGGVVVERSKEHPPAWVGLAPDRLHESNGLFKFVEVQSLHSDLPFGIKKTQLDALDGSKAALVEKISAVLARLQGISPSAIQNEKWKSLVEDTTDEVHREHARVADIYFERLTSDTPVGPKELTEYYRAQVLVFFPKQTYGELLKTLGDRLEASSDRTLRDLGLAMKDSLAAEITH